jgi:hypothetical protein
VQQQGPKERTLTTAAERKHPTVFDHLEWAKKTEFQLGSPVESERP